MTLQKRLFDICAGLCLSVLLLVPFLVLVVVLRLSSKEPVFYISERMKSATEGFQLIKFRTMRGAVENTGVSGADKANRITRVGRFLRRSRLDEVPQLWNILRGDISFVGPRPPLREYVERFPETYDKVLEARPGLTGLATVRFHAHEEWWLSQSLNVEHTDQIYVQSCIPRKAALDLIYQEHGSLCFDILILCETALPSLRRRLF